MVVGAGMIMSDYIVINHHPDPHLGQICHPMWQQLLFLGPILLDFLWMEIIISLPAVPMIYQLWVSLQLLCLDWLKGWKLLLLRMLIVTMGLLISNQLTCHYVHLLLIVALKGRGVLTYMVMCVPFAKRIACIPIALKKEKNTWRCVRKIKNTLKP